jgi:hypothetical protein
MESTFSRGVQWIAKETLEGFHFIMGNAASAPPWGEEGREGERLIMGALARGLPHHVHGSEWGALGVGRGMLRPAGPGRH